MSCDMCGDTLAQFQCSVEGITMHLCEKCAKFGKIIKKVPVQETKKKQKNEKEILHEEIEILQVIVHDYARKIKNAREKKADETSRLCKKHS